MVYCTKQEERAVLLVQTVAKGLVQPNYQKNKIKIIKYVGGSNAHSFMCSGFPISENFLLPSQ